jgi:hypothetical protein
MMCHSNKTESPCFPEAIRRADFTLSAPQVAISESKLFLRKTV